MNEVEVTLLTPDEFHVIRPLWHELYAEQSRLGMQLKVPPDGFELWSQTILPTLGRFSCAFVARRESAVAGFLAGRLRAVPGYFGGGQVGFISEVFVAATARKLGVGAKMVSAACSWFKAAKVSRVELQVLLQNESARALYRKLGWRDEVIEMVWATEAQNPR